jgi:hypothetical protein
MEQGHALWWVPLAVLYMPAITLCGAGAAVYGAAGCAAPFLRSPSKRSADMLAGTQEVYLSS